MLVVDALREVLLLLMMMREESFCAAIALPPHVAQPAVLVSERGRPRVQPAEWEIQGMHQLISVIWKFRKSQMLEFLDGAMTTGRLTTIPRKYHVSNIQEQC